MYEEERHRLPEDELKLARKQKKRQLRHVAAVEAAMAGIVPNTLATTAATNNNDDGGGGGGDRDDDEELHPLFEAFRNKWVSPTSNVFALRTLITTAVIFTTTASIFQLLESILRGDPRETRHQGIMTGVKMIVLMWMFAGSSLQWQLR